MLISFIIPSYNSAHTVKRCLDSIYALSLRSQEFEVIFIDDCSTDSTCDIVTAYIQYLLKEKGVTNLTLLRQHQNNRQGAARNRGVSVAKGEYICFVDSDDAVAEGIVSAIRTAKDLQTDMTAFHYANAKDLQTEMPTFHYGNANEQGVITEEKEHLSFAPKQTFSGIEMQNTHPFWCSAPWGYIYSRVFLDRAAYPFAEGVLYEDSDFVAVHLYYAQRMAYSSELGYVAYYREGSTTHSISYKNIADYLQLGTRMLDFHFVISRHIADGIRSDVGIQYFADGVLEGACYNIGKSLKYLRKLDNKKEIEAFYDRVDARINRHELYQDRRLYSYPNYWNLMAHIGIRHKNISIALNSCLAFFYKVYRKLKIFKR